MSGTYCWPNTVVLTANDGTGKPGGYSLQNYATLSDTSVPSFDADFDFMMLGVLQQVWSQLCAPYLVSSLSLPQLNYNDSSGNV